MKPTRIIEKTESQVKKKLIHRSSGGEIHDDTQNVIPSSENEGKPVLAGRALFCLGPNNPLRQKVFELIAHPLLTNSFCSVFF